MSENFKHKSNKSSVLDALASALSDKKEIKHRVKNGENLREITKEKGLKVVLPL
jgi:hypothetical protein